jgi:hypothetical protein
MDFIDLDSLNFETLGEQVKFHAAASLSLISIEQNLELWSLALRGCGTLAVGGAPSRL